MGQGLHTMGQGLHTRPRIEVVDALRGFAVLAIVLLHNIEHFNLYDFPEPSADWLKSLDSGIWNTLFFLFSGKGYAIFALLFGFSFFIQFDNQARKGKDFRLRFFWRLILLFCLGCFNAAFFPGDILVLYAIIGVVLIPVCKLSDKVVLGIAIFLMLQPMEWGKFFYASFHPEYVATPELWTTYGTQMVPYLTDSSFWAMVKSNLWAGQLFSLLWGWSYGRFFQTAALFMLGMLLGRKGIFAHIEEHKTFWKRVLIWGAICFIPLYFLALALPDWFTRTEMLNPMNTIVSSLRNLAFTCVLVGAFVLLWQWETPRKWLHVLVPYGKMSLTNYITQSMIGSFLYFGYGLSLYDDFCTTVSFSVGIFLFLLQLGFCHWWLKNHKHGPFEGAWRKATWIGS